MKIFVVLLILAIASEALCKAKKVQAKSPKRALGRCVNGQTHYCNMCLGFRSTIAFFVGKDCSQACAHNLTECKDNGKLEQDNGSCHNGSTHSCNICLAAYAATGGMKDCTVDCADQVTKCRKPSRALSGLKRRNLSN